MVLLVRGNLIQSLTNLDAIPDGSVDSPGLKFAYNQQSGLYRTGDSIGLSVQGQGILTANTTDVTVSGNITTGGYLLGNGAFLEGVASSNASSLTEGQLLNSLLPPTIGNTSTNFVGDGQYLSNVSRGVRSTLIANADLTTVTLVANALQSVTPEAVHVHVNGIQLAYIDANVADYTITTTQDLANVTTAFEITLTDPLSNGDVVDVLVSTGASLNEASNGAYYETVYANTLEVYDVTFGGNSVLSNADIEVVFAAGNVQTVDGSAAVPSYSWENANTTGFYLEGANVGMTVEGTQKAQVSTDGVRVDGNVVCTGTFVGDGSQLTGIKLPPSINTITITNASWTPIDDTALSTSSTGYLVIDGGNFETGTNVSIGGTAAASITLVDSTTLRVSVNPKTTGTYDVVVQTGGGSAIKVNAVSFDPVPVWTTGTSLGNVYYANAFSITLAASDGGSNMTYSNTTALPPSTTLATNGTLSGNITETSSTTYNFSVEAIDVQLQSALRSFTLAYNKTTTTTISLTVNNASQFGDDTSTVNSFWSSYTLPFLTSKGIQSYTGYYAATLTQDATCTFTVGGAAGWRNTNGRSISASFALSANTRLVFFAGKATEPSGSQQQGAGGGASCVMTWDGTSFTPLIIAAGGSSSYSGRKYDLCAPPLSETTGDVGAVRNSILNGSGNVVGSGGVGRGLPNTAQSGGAGWGSRPTTNQTAGVFVLDESVLDSLQTGARGGNGMNGGSPGGFGGGGGDWDGNSYCAGGGGYWGGWEGSTRSSPNGEYSHYTIYGGEGNNNKAGPLSYVNPLGFNVTDNGLFGSTNDTGSVAGQTQGQVTIAFFT